MGAIQQKRVSAVTNSQESDIPTQDTTDTTSAPDQESALSDVLDSSASTEPHQPAAENAAHAASEQEAIPKPAAPKPSAISPAAMPAAKPVQSAVASSAQQTPVAPAVPAFRTELDEARKFAEVAEDGHVTLIDGDEKVPVGQVPDAPQDEALSYFVRKHDDLMTQVLLLEQRLTTDTSTAELRKTFVHLRASAEERKLVGDMAALRNRLSQLDTALEQRRDAEQQVHQEAIEAQRSARLTIVEEAEQIADQDPQRVQWKQSSQRMNTLFDAWKSAQKSGPRLPKPEEDELWKRFRTARSTFDKHRRAFFSQLDANNAEAKQVKERLISRAEELSSSTEWGNTAAKYRDLMAEWKAAPRASRREDDALWARFRAAQDVFFNARKAVNHEIDREFAENLKVKEAILDEGDQQLPFKNVNKARQIMNGLRGRWEDAGKVPRKDISRMESGFRRLEDALAKAEDEHWRRTDPEMQARTNSVLSQLEETIADLEKDLEQAQQRGDEKAIKKAEEALETRQQWLRTLQQSSAED